MLRHQAQKASFDFEPEVTRHPRAYRAARLNQLDTESWSEIIDDRYEHDLDRLGFSPEFIGREVEA